MGPPDNRSRRYEILEEADLEVLLVNARDTKNQPGRKSDVQENQWMMKLHAYRLLRNSFRPPQEIRSMRTYSRQRSVGRPNDDQHWTRGGTWPHDLGSKAQIGISVEKAAGFTMDFDYVRVYRLTTQ